MERDELERSDLDRALMASRLITIALIGGEVLFALVIAFAGLQGLAENPRELDVLTWVGLALGALAIPTAVGVRVVLMARREELAGHAFLDRTRVALLVYAAILEGACMLNLLVWMLLGTAVPSALIAGVLVLVQAVGYPQEHHFEPPRGS